MLKRYFFTGLATLLPVVITVLVVVFFVNLLTRPFVNIVEDILGYYNIAATPQALHLLSRVVIIFLMAIFVCLTGFFANLVITKYIIRLGDYIFHRIPYINKIYKASQEVVTTLLDESHNDFNKVVMVPFPDENSYSLGLVTNDSDIDGRTSVFIPAIPNPTMGFMLLIKKEEVTTLDMKVEDALKIILSCGSMMDKI